MAWLDSIIAIWENSTNRQKSKQKYEYDTDSLKAIIDSLRVREL